MYQVLLKSFDIYSSYRPENENMGVSRADNSVKSWRNLPISNPKPDLHNINAQIKFGENPSGNEKWTDGRTDGRTTDGRTDIRTSNVKP